MTEPVVEPKTEALKDASLIGNSPDFTLLRSKDEYTRYFTLLERVWRALMQSYELSESENTYEAGVVHGYLERLLYTVNTLRMKYTHSPADQRHALD